MAGYKGIEMAGSPLASIRRHLHLGNFLGVGSRILLMLAVVLIVAAAALAWRLSSGPLTLNIFADAVRARIAESVGPEARVRLDAIVLAWTIDGGPRVRLRGLVVSDRASGLAAELPTTDVRVKGWDLLFGRFTPQSINLYSPRLAIPVDAGASTAPDIFLQFAHRSLGELKKSAWAIGLTGIRVNDATIELRSTDPQGHSRTWSDVEASLLLQPAEQTLALDAKGIGYGGAWSIAACHEPHSSGHGSTLTVAANDITLDDILGASAGLPTASAMRIPLYPNFSARFDDGGALREAELKIIVGAGYIEFGDDDTQLLDEARLDLYWAADKRSLEIRPSVVEFGETVFRFTGRVAPPMEANDAIWNFGFFSEDSTIASDSVDGPPAKLDAILVSGSVDFDSLLVEISQFGVNAAGKPALAGRGHVDLGAFGPKITVDLSVLPVPARLVKQLWPGFVAPPARRWVMANVGDGEEVEGYVRAIIGEAELDGDPETFGWGDDDVQVSFKAKNVDVKTFGALPRLQIDTLNGRITGGLFEADVASGFMATPSGGRVRISDGRFVIGDIRPRNQTANLRLALSGSAKDVGAIVDADPIGAIRRIGVTPKGLKGKVDGKVQAALALIKDLPFDDIDWSLDAQLTGFGSEDPIAGRKVDKGDLRLLVDGAAAKITGKASFDGTVASVDLVEPFDGRSGGVSKLGIKIRLTEEERKKQGIDLDGVLRGPVDVAIDTGDDGEERYKVDLTEAEFVLPMFDWTKKAGIPAAASFALVKGKKGDRVRELEIESRDLAIVGDVKLDPKGGIESGAFTRFRIGKNDIHLLKVTRRKDDGMEIDVAANAIDARPIIDSITGPSGSKNEPQKNITIRAAADRLYGYNSATLNGVEFSARVVDGRTMSMTLVGQSGKRDVTRAELRPDGVNRQLVVSSENAGDFFRFLNLYKRMRGGKAELTATMVGPSRATGRFRVRNFRVSEDQALKQLVKRGNFESVVNDSRPLDMRPIAETGDAVFDGLAVAFALDGDRLTIGDALLKGRAIGGTMKGNVNFATKRISITGTIVPAYGINNMFGRIPLLGEALGGGRNGGLFGVTFKMAGRIGKTEMVINPVSAVAPGIFRKVFEYQ